MSVTSEFKIACRKAGIALGVMFISRLVAEGVILLLSLMLKDADPTASYLICTLVSILFMYICPIAITMKLFGHSFSKNKKLYKKCDRMGKAVSWILPCYGAGQMINLIVLVISFLIANNKNAVADTFAPITSGGGTASSSVTTIALIIQLVVLAPLFEEFWFRGIIQTGLSKYGHGFSIMVSALFFGLAHGNVHQFCYTFVIGILLGYVRYATDSLVPTTIIHAILNSIPAIILAFTSSEPIISGMVKNQMGMELNSLESTMFTILGILLIAIFIFMIIGMISTISKLRHNRLYRPVNNYPEMTKSEKLIALLKEPVFTICCILSFAFMMVIIFI